MTAGVGADRSFDDGIHKLDLNQIESLHLSNRLRTSGGHAQARFSHPECGGESGNLVGRS
ncbi:MAG: hypothetical protein EBT08_14780 [Betaproteobacteria bacterium]|nr:hypothetical protein [Betaproteobacteria bacterium]